MKALVLEGGSETVAAEATAGRQAVGAVRLLAHPGSPPLPALHYLYRSIIEET